MELSASGFGVDSEPEPGHLALIPGLPDDIALFCLARVPRKYHTALKCVSRRWRDLVCSEDWRAYRRKRNLDETWIYALCRNKETDQIRFFVLDPSATRQGCWKPIPMHDRCLKRKGIGFVTLGKKLYLLGGCSWTEDATDEVHFYDASSHAWSQAAPMSTARCYFGCEALGGKIFAIGGIGTETGDLRSWDTYDPCTNTWESHSNSNIINDIEDSIVMDGKIYIRSRAPAIPTPTCIAVYDPSSGKWQQADSDMALGWSGPAVVVDENLYVLDQSSGTKLMMWLKKEREWVAMCRLSSLVTRPPCKMVAVGRKIVIVGKGLSTVVVDVGAVSSTDGMIASSSIPVRSDDGIISCKSVSI